MEYSPEEEVKSLSLRAIIQSKALEKGLSSDITVVAFGTRYRLHRTFLRKSPFFERALSSTWEDKSADEFTMYPDAADSLITQRAFENVLMYLYETNADLETVDEGKELFALSCFLLLDDLAEHCIENIVRLMTNGDIASMLMLVTKYEYGKAGSQLRESVKALVCIHGSDLPLKVWDDIPPDIMVDLLSSDSFHVASEWDRYQYSFLILNRKLALAVERGHVAKPHGNDFSALPIYRDPVVVKLRSLLQEKIRYALIPFNLLQRIRSHRDILGARIVPGDLLDNVVWRGAELRQKVIHADTREVFLSGATDVYQMLDGERPVEQYRVSKADGILLGGAEWPLSVTRSNLLSMLLDRMDDPYPIPATCPFPPFRFSVQFPSPQQIKVGRKYQSRRVWYSGSTWCVDVFISRVRPGRLNVRIYRTLPAFLDEGSAVDWATESAYRTMRSNASQSDGLTGASTVVTVERSGFSYFGEETTHLDAPAHMVLPQPHMDGIVLPQYGETRDIPASGGASSNSDEFAGGERLRTCDFVPFTDHRTCVAAYCRLSSNLAAGSKGTMFETKVEAIGMTEHIGWQVDLNSTKCQLDSWSKEDTHSNLRFTVVLGVL